MRTYKGAIMNFDLTPAISRETKKLNAEYKKLNRASKVWLGIGVAAIAFQGYLIVRIQKEL